MTTDHAVPTNLAALLAENEALTSEVAMLRKAHQKAVGMGMQMEEILRSDLAAAKGSAKYGATLGIRYKARAERAEQTIKAVRELIAPSKPALFLTLEGDDEQGDRLFRESDIRGALGEDTP